MSNKFKKIITILCASFLMLLNFGTLALADTTQADTSNKTITTVSNKSPNSTGITIIPSSDVTSSNPDLTEKLQVVITYDKPIKAAVDAVNDFNVAMNGKSYPSSSLKVYVDPSDSHKLIFDIMIGFALYAGNLTIIPANSAGITKVTSEDGSAAITWKDINVYAPNGVKLETVSSVTADTSKKINASVTKKMTQLGKLRGMVHYIFLKNGQPIGDVDSYGASVVAHYHMYTTLTAETYVPSIVSALNTKYGSEYTFTSDKDTFTVTAKNSENGDVLDVRVFAYPQDRDADKTELNSEIEKASAITAENYTKESYNNLQSEIVKDKKLAAEQYSLQSDVDAAVNNLKTAIDVLKYSTKEMTIEDETTGIIVKGELPSPAAKLYVKSISTLSDFDESIGKLASDDEKYKSKLAYDLNLLDKNGDKVVFDGNGSAIVSIKLPESLLTKKFAIFYINDNGVATKIGSSISDGVISFTTTHFSKYVVAEISEVTSGLQGNENNNQDTNTVSNDNKSNQATNTQTSSTSIASNTNASGTNNGSSSTVSTTSNVENPKTGDFTNSNILILIISIISLASLALLKINKKRIN